MFKKLRKTKLGANMLDDKRYRTVAFAVLSLIFNLLFAFYNGILGILHGSVWFIASCFFYLLLCAMRFFAVANDRKKSENGAFVMRSVGIMLTVLCFVLSAILYISLSQSIATPYGTITMITIATYTFSKIAMAIFSAIKAKSESSPTLSVIRNIRYADVAFSLFTMQKSMLVSFGNEMDTGKALILNIFTGTCVFIFTLFLGIYLIRKSLEVKNNEQ